MNLPLKRIFDEKRRMLIPVLAGLALNIVLYMAVAYPMSVRARTAESRAARAEAALQAAERDERSARGIAEGRDRTDVALKSFYKDVLPTSMAEAQESTYLRLAQLADQHNVRRSRTNADQATDRESSLVRLQITTSLQGEYEDLRRFIYQVESGTDFIVIDSIALRQGGEPGAPLTLDLHLSTYFRARPGGA
jgi:hypothetical protein